MSTVADVAGRPHRELERMAAELALEREQLRAILDVSPAAIAITHGPEHVVRSANLALRRLTAGDVVGRSARAALLELVGQDLLQRMDDVYAKGEPFAGELLVPSFPAGHESAWDAVVRPLRAPEGVVVGLLLQLLDVTGRAGARAGVEATTSGNARVLAEITHEFRTPLSAVIGYAELLENSLREVASATDLEYLRRIGRAAWDMNVLAEDILTLARAQVGRLDVKPDIVDAVAAISGVAAMLEGEAALKGLQLSVVSSREALHVRTDPTKLRQILVNVVGNAVKFTDLGQVSVTSDVVAEELVVRVADSGPGIEPEHLEAIFEPFARPGAVARVKAGAGVGLPLSRELARALGGALEVESVPGSGSTFTLRLPLTPPACAPASSPQA